MTFTASNGITVDSETQALTGYRRIKFASENQGETFELPGAYMKALIEALDNERDEELGRWRWPENPDYVVYRFASRNVRVLRESIGKSLEYMDEGAWPSNPSDYSAAARAYFEAHPEPKPWHDAKAGEVWALTINGDPAESAWTVNNEGRFENPDSTYELTNRNITDARKIWPEPS